MTTERPLILANSSAFFGDRFSAVAEMVRGGHIDVLTGDYLAELTTAILFKQRAKDPRRGYVQTFLAQIETVLGECLERRIRVVTNAGGLNPKGLADALSELAAKLGLAAKVAYIEGDDLMPRLNELRSAGETFAHFERGTPLAASNLTPVTANAYLGGRAVATALEGGADIVVCPRVTDAALVVGPCVWHFDWSASELDAIAGAVAAGHVLECGAQACGGNYAFFREVKSLRRVGYPLAEVRRDGSFVVTKHAGTGGLVSRGTVTAQLLYEIEGPRYVTPDVVARFDSLSLADEGPDRVLVTGARGEPPPPSAKVSVNALGGYRNAVTFVLCGLDIDEKAALVEDALADALGGRQRFSSFDVDLRGPRPGATTNDEALAYLRVTVTSPDEKRVGRSFSNEAVALALASVPGLTLTAPPGDASPEVVFWPTRVDNRHLAPVVVTPGGDRIAVPSVAPTAPVSQTPVDRPAALGDDDPYFGPRAPAPLGWAFGARSGDKGGSANLGIWATSEFGYEYLRAYLSVGRLKALLPELAPFEVERHEFPNLWAVNFWVRDLLGDGASSSRRADPQAKTLGEFFRSRVGDLPTRLVAR